MSASAYSEQLTAVARQLDHIDNLIPADVHIGVAVHGGGERPEINVHGCSPSELRAVREAWPHADVTTDEYGHTRYIEINLSAMSLTFYHR